MMSPCLLLSFVPSFGKNIYGDKGEIVLFLRCPHNAVSVYTFSGDIVLVYAHDKKSHYTPYSLLLYFGTENS